MRVFRKIVAIAMLTLASAAVAATGSQKPRVLVLTDIGNEPDDSESFVRFLLYANHFDIEGLVATTSTWQRSRVQPQLLRERVAAYAEVLPNLRRHAEGYPDPMQLERAIVSGSAEFGMRGVGEGKDTEASRRIVEIVDRSDPRPVYISVWGGAVDLAQALWSVRQSRTPEDVQAFVAKLRVYSISDQDDAGPWIRLTFPELFWIASVHGWGQYGLAAWTGISGDLLRQEKWPHVEMVTNEWLNKHVRRGPLGALYPPHEFIMEGDTPSFLGLIPNGLNDPEHPEWGGWGGRYAPVYEGAAHRGDTMDRFIDDAGVAWSGNQATIYRWRQAFQNDFAARIAWTLSPSFKDANHNPLLLLNGQGGHLPVHITASPGSTVHLSAEGSTDPDGQPLKYRWWQYAEVSNVPGQVAPRLEIESDDGARAHFVVPVVEIPTRFHVILEVTDRGSPPLTSYRRSIIEVRP